MSLSVDAFPDLLVPPPASGDSAVRAWLEPPLDHHSRSFWASGASKHASGSKLITPVCTSEPQRPSLNSLTMTPFKTTTGVSANFLSSCFALSPQIVMSRLVAESSATVMTRFVSSCPLRAVKDMHGRKAVMTPHMSTLLGSARWPTDRRLTTVNLIASIFSAVPSSARAMRAVLSKVISYRCLHVLNCRLAILTLPLAMV
mmetsp:Transcript_11177/g.31640  ORF Transcript_11177/g.31640 Transcript_11177/m.31640 type:complete len:201 (-) Transcript_11177:306-908(-)